MTMLNACAALPSSPNARALYFTTSDAARNSITALKVAANGTLSECSITPTGGKGLSGIDSEHNNQPSAPDSLFSQSAIHV